jgi:lycopene cyclase domain-containing protein
VEFDLAKMPLEFSYLAINLVSIAIPFLLSFEKRVQFFKQWKFLFPAIALMMLLFVSWDAIFTSLGVWGFNPNYLTGTYLFNLPLEEWLFFICIPYACLFTYEVVRYFNQKDILFRYRRNITNVLILFFVVVVIIFYDKLYTMTTFAGTAVLLLVIKISKKDAFLGQFYMTYLITLFPFFVVNGILTGSFLESPIVWYNDAENLGIRIGTIPLDDTIYSMFMLLLTTYIYEELKNTTLIK